MKMAMIMMTLVMVVFIVCGVALISLLGRRNAMECFYVEDDILYLNSLFIKKIPLSDIRHIEFETFRSRGSYSGIIRVYQKNAKVIKRYFQTSKIAFFVSEQMVLAEIEKITPILKKYYIPYTIKNN